MAIPSKREIIEFSPMNRGGKEELPALKRKPIALLEKGLKTGLITAVTGLRRVGKTTLIKQALAGRGAFYFSFDEKRYANPDALKRVIDAFVSESDKPLIALDEVFRVEDWSGVVKRYHDQKLARFVVSGSSALMVKKGAESLGGRMLEYAVPPLQFDEYLELVGRNAGPALLPLRDAFKAKRQEEAAEAFLWKGSFPEITGFDRRTAREYVRSSTVEKIVFDDIPSMFRIEHASKLYDLMRLCATSSARLFTESGFSEALQMSRHAVNDYLLYLEKAYLARPVYPEGSFQKALKKQKKIFVKTASIYDAVAENPSAGQAAETAVYDKLSASAEPVFYRDSQQREVDFIMGKTPIEVKYASTVTSDDTRHLRYYMERRGASTGIVVTKDFFDEKTAGGRTIRFVPLDVFLQSDISGGTGK